MAGKEKTERRLFIHQSLTLAPISNVQVGGRFVASICAIEQASLHRVTLSLFRRIHRQVNGCQKFRAMGVDRIKRAGTYQCLDHTLVHHTFVDAATEIEQIGECAAASRRAARARLYARLFAHSLNRRQRCLSGSLDRAKAVTDCFGIDWTKAYAADVDVRRQKSQTVFDPVFEKEMHFVRIGHFR